ncbi:hypothetical protein AB835_01510 [Candidatus Endobugula sertula]|uniref:Uncharacterized protein n=1 Tax=Candidatus Endobugula sertula TaxID=62101 RepID=A0A1D2QT71_9GAMM|nr:hypothetical protein AB835_01510 [Candidatus Endobugula sertula]
MPIPPLLGRAEPHKIPFENKTIDNIEGCYESKISPKSIQMVAGAGCHLDLLFKKTGLSELKPEY